MFLKIWTVHFRFITSKKQNQFSNAACASCSDFFGVYVWAGERVGWNG